MKPAAIAKKTKQIRRWLVDTAELSRNVSYDISPAKLMREFDGLTLEQATSIHKRAMEPGTVTELEQHIYLVLENAAGGKELTWLCSFLDQNKRVIDHVVYKAPTRNDARRQAIDLYAKNGDKGLYAGFVVTEEKHGGY